MCPFNRTTFHKSVDFASFLYCRRVSHLGMHINSLKILVFTGKSDLFYAQAMMSVFHSLTLFWGGRIYYLFTFNCYIHISGIWNLKKTISLITRTFLVMATHFITRPLYLRTPAKVSCPGPSLVLHLCIKTLFSACSASKEATLQSWLSRGLWC